MKMRGIRKRFNVLLSMFMVMTIILSIAPTSVYAQEPVTTQRAPKVRNYRVRHIRQSVDGTYRDESLAYYETLTGRVGNRTKAVANRSYEGFQALIPEQVTIAPSGDITVSVYYARRKFTTYFKTGDSSQDFYETFLYGTKQSTPAQPRIPGKTFRYWEYRDAKGNWKVWNPGIQQAGDLTVYARYNVPMKSTYVINYWYQKSSDQLSYSDAEKNYSLYATETKTQDINTDVVYNGTLYESTYRKYNRRKTEAENARKTVRLDGTTVVNVYYDRPVMTITLVYYNLSTKKEDHREKYQAIYGHSTTGIFSLNPKYKWTSKTDPGRQTDTPSTFGKQEYYMTDDYHTEYHARELESTNKDIKVYAVVHYQNTDGTWTKDIRTKKQGLVTDESNFYYYFPESSSYFHPLYYWTNSENEFTTDVSSSNPNLVQYQSGQRIYVLRNKKPVNDYDGDGVSYIHFYLSRKSFQLKFVNADNRPVSLFYGAPLSYAKNSLDHPIKPASVPRHYVFGGWYTTSTFQKGSELNLKSTMGTQNRFVYAKWEEPRIKVTIKSNGATSKLPSSVTIPMNSSIHKEIPTIPSRDGYWFDGWYKDAEFTKPFDVNEKIDKDMTIYAKWKGRARAKWLIRYVDKNGKVLSESDIGTSNLYSVLTVYAKKIANYTADYASKNLTLSSSDQINRLEFVYSKNVLKDKNIKKTKRIQTPNTADGSKVESYMVFLGMSLLSFLWIWFHRRDKAS